MKPWIYTIGNDYEEIPFENNNKLNVKQKVDKNSFLLYFLSTNHNEYNPYKIEKMNKSYNNKNKEQYNTIDSTNILNHLSNNEIFLKYEIKYYERRVRIFGYDFVEKNKNNFCLIYLGKEYKLNEYLDIQYNQENINIFEIKLKIINNFTDI